MCIIKFQKVKSMRGQIATLENGSRVKINLLKRVQKGDLLEVYGDLALSRIDTATRPGVN